MLATIRMSTWLDGEMVREPKVLPIKAVREALMLVTDSDEDEIDYIFMAVEETGSCHLLDDDGEQQFILERVLHS